MRDGSDGCSDVRISIEIAVVIGRMLVLRFTVPDTASLCLAIVL